MIHTSKRSNSIFGPIFKKTIPSPKTSQTTIFIIVGIIIAVLIVLLFLNFKNITNQPFDSLNFNKKIEIIQEFTQECFKRVYIDSLDFVGAQGGYAKEPLGPYVSEVGLYMPIYNFNGTITIPDNDIIELELSLIID